MQRSIRVKKSLMQVPEAVEVYGDFEKINELCSYHIYKELADETTYGKQKLERIFESNLSTEYTILVQNAGRWCERYASDIIVDIEEVKHRVLDNPLEFLDGEKKKEISFLFGFRQDGVDYNSFIESRLMQGTPIEFYRAIYELKLFVEETDNGRLNISYGFARLH